jgi:cytochrome c oxidase subunit II
MEHAFQLLPERASSYAAQVDHLYWFLVGLSGFFGGLIVVLILVFAVKYRRSVNTEAEQPTESTIGLELFWTVVPSLIALVIFVWSASVYLAQTTPPRGAQDIFVVGKQWMWKIQHSNGRREINELHVPVGQAIKITATTQDVIHSFFIPAFRIKQDAVPGQYRTMWFRATKPGVYHLFCAEYCGTAHSRMIGRVVVLDDNEYQQWLAGYTGKTPLEEGEQLFVSYDCASCHESGRRQRCPNLGGLYGTQVALENGQSVLFDEAYIRESILDPRAKIAKGFPPVMPTFRGQLSEEQILALIAYIKSLTPTPEGKQP